MESIERTAEHWNRYLQGASKFWNVRVKNRPRVNPLQEACMELHAWKRFLKKTFGNDSATPRNRVERRALEAYKRSYNKRKRKAHSRMYIDNETRDMWGRK